MCSSRSYAVGTGSRKYTSWPSIKMKGDNSKWIDSGEEYHVGFWQYIAKCNLTYFFLSTNSFESMPVVLPRQTNESTNNYEKCEF